MSVSVSASNSAFSTLLTGTDDSLWRAALEMADILSLPASASILVVSPHPDDEILGAGGLIHAAAKANQPVAVLSVTDGEAAYSDWCGLGRVRRQEVSDALRVLTDKNIDLQSLQIPDGHIAQHRARLFDAIDRHVSRRTLIIAPFEDDGHPDHDATGEVCAQVAKLRAVTLWRYPIWTWHHSAPDSFADDSWGRLALDADAIEAKAQALRCFRSQMCPVGRQPIVPPHVLQYFERPYEAFLI